MAHSKTTTKTIASHSSAARRSGATSLLAASLLLACGSDPAAPDAQIGRPGQVIEVDAGSIPLGEAQAQGGAGGSSASSGKGGTSSTGGASGTSDPHGLSSPCESASDCTQPLTCHQSPVDYIAHKQCGLFCDADETCTAAFGANATCIGARTCVQKCDSDLDCAERTHCNDNGWCERGGPGSGIPYCSGSATPCSALSSLQCIGASGCKDDSRCSGSPPSCYSQSSSYSCEDIDGCNWSSSSKSCSGSAHSCSSYYSEASCGFQDGCHWSGGCYGVHDACSKQFVSLCENQPGCFLTTD